MSTDESMDNDSLSLVMLVYLVYLGLNNLVSHQSWDEWQRNQIILTIDTLHRKCSDRGTWLTQTDYIHICLPTILSTNNFIKFVLFISPAINGLEQLLVSRMASLVTLWVYDVMMKFSFILGRTSSFPLMLLFGSKIPDQGVFQFTLLEFNLACLHGITGVSYDMWPSVSHLMSRYIVVHMSHLICDLLHHICNPDPLWYICVIWYVIFCITSA